MNMEFQAEIRSELTGKSYNQCLDEIYDEYLIEQMRYEKEVRAQCEAELREQYETDKGEGYES